MAGCVAARPAPGSHRRIWQMAAVPEEPDNSVRLKDLAEIVIGATALALPGR